MVLPAIIKGWKWEGSRCKFAGVSDHEKDMSDAHYTTTELAKAMSSLVTFLNFTGEDESQFPGERLPTLDTELWMENKQIMYSFFEKATVGNKVICRDTALPQTSIRSSLLQETVRRMVNCSEKLDLESRQNILSKFAQKLINSGHSVESAKVIIVQGVTKYVNKVKMSKLDKTDSRYKPLYLSKEYNE